MGEWTIEQWGAAIVVWLWGTWISGKVVDGAQANFEARILSIYPDYKMPDRYLALPPWLVGAVCAWIKNPVDENIHLPLQIVEWVGMVFVACILYLIPILFISFFGWAVFNQFGMAKALFDAGVLRGKSLKPND